MTRIDEKVLKKAVKSEDTSLADVKKGVRSGYIVVPNNKKRRISKPCAIGKGMTTKVNANIGLSPGKSSLSAELKKMEVAIKAGADTVMDLSTGPLLKKVRKEIISNC
ncbi:MAG: phosphomethylpyrimidine synthase ThiC, partial [Candidatus Omnitrophota bacterium]